MLNIKNNIEALPVPSKEAIMELTLRKSMYMFLFHEQEAGQNYNKDLFSIRNRP
jgi:hypothetical protein